MNVHSVELIEQDDMVCLAMRREGDFEPDSVKAWIEQAKKGGVMIDVGAYTGLYSILAAKITNDEVVAFEPNKKCYDRMWANIHNAGMVISGYPYAVGAEEGMVSMDNTEGRPRLTSAGKVKEGGDIPMVKLDDLSPVDPVTAIKIDVEGYELDVLVGASAILERCAPMVIAEALDSNAEKALIDYMAGYGYEYRKADKRNLIFR